MGHSSSLQSFLITQQCRVIRKAKPSACITSTKYRFCVISSPTNPSLDDIFKFKLSYLRGRKYQLPPSTNRFGVSLLDLGVARAAMKLAWAVTVAASLSFFLGRFLLSASSSCLRLFSSRRKVWSTGAAATRDCSSQVS